MSNPEKRLYEFDSFCIDAQKRLLLRAGEVLSLTPKAFDTLLALVEMRGRVIEKDELMESVWGETIVEESALSRNIYLLRKALGEQKDEHRYIVTVPGRGYRFVANVKELPTAPAEIIVATHTRTHVVVEKETEEEREREREGARTAENKSLPIIVSPSLRRAISPSLLIASAVLAALLLGFAYWRKARPTRNTQFATLNSIAVLPFKPLTADSADEVLQIGMADVLIMRLSNVRQLIVRPISAVRKYSSLEQDPVIAGRELQVDAVLDGNLQRLTDRIRVTVRLVSTKNGATLWADKFDEKLTDLFTVEDKLSERLADTLALQLTGEEKQLLVKRYTENPDAYQAYLKGRFFWSKWTKDSLLKAIESFEQALKIDPNYAPAYSGIADAHNLLGYLGFVPVREAFPQSEAAAIKALQLDNSLGEAHLSLAKTKLFYDWNWPDAEREIQRAIALNPNYADAHGMYGAYLTVMGKFDEALIARKRALELDPLSPLFVTQIGWVYFYQRKYNEAIEWYRKALELEPNFRLALDDLGNAYYLQGDLNQAIATILKNKALTGEPAENIVALQQAYNTAGKIGFWRQELEFAKTKHVSPWRMARIYTELGEKDQAFGWLDKAYEERASLLPFLKEVPFFDSLHADQRFIVLIRRIGLTQ